MTLHDPAERAWRPGHDVGTVESHEPAGTGNISTGLELRPYFVRWLDHSIYRQSAIGRLAELEEFYPEAHHAHLLRKRRLTQHQIAAEMGVNQGTVSRLLVKAERYIARGTNSGDAFSAEERAMLYADLYPDRFEVYLYRTYGWSLERVVEMSGKPERTVKRYCAHAHSYIGEYLPRRRLKRFAPGTKLAA